jgi:hypothetical protein
MLVDRALPGDGGGMAFGMAAAGGGALGEPCGFRSSLPPRIDDIDMPPAGRYDANEARSRAPAKGEAVGGPRGAEPGNDDALEGRWGGEGGGIWRDWKLGGGGGGSMGPKQRSAMACDTSCAVCRPCEGCGGLPLDPPPKDRLREGS